MGFWPPIFFGLDCGVVMPYDRIAGGWRCSGLHGLMVAGGFWVGLGLMGFTVMGCLGGSVGLDVWTLVEVRI